MAKKRTPQRRRPGKPGKLSAKESGKGHLFFVKIAKISPAPRPGDLTPLMTALLDRDANGALREFLHLPSPWREACRLPLPAWDEERLEQPHPALYVLAAYFSHRSFQGDATRAEIKAWRALEGKCLTAIRARWKSNVVRVACPSITRLP